MKKIVKKVLPKLIGLQLNALYRINPQKALQKAYLLFCTPRRGEVKPIEEDFLNQAKREVLKICDRDIQTYHWPGKGKSILLVHGWESNSFRWKPLVEQLQLEEYNIFSLDAPAQGNSSGEIIQIPLYADCLQQVIERYRPEVLIGHSMGAMTCVYEQYCKVNRDIKEMVLLGSPSELHFLIDDFKRLLQLKPGFMAGFENFFKEKLGYRFDEFSIAKFAKDLPQKGLIIHDKNDKIAPFAASEAIHKNWENSTLHPTEGLGHGLNNAKVYHEILQFLKA